MRRKYFQGKGNYCSKLKKGKLKIKELFKITFEREASGQSKDRTTAVKVWSWGNVHLAKPASVYLKINSGFHYARKNPKKQYLNVSMFSDASFSKKCAYAFDRSSDNMYSYIHWTGTEYQGYMRKFWH